MKKEFFHDALLYENDSPICLIVPFAKIVCPCCNGTGVEFGSDCDESRMVEDMYEDCDYEGLESYYRGAYDRVCSECNGKNVVDEIDWNFIEINYPKEYLAIKQYENNAYNDRQYELAEKRALGYFN
jgi:hypothetical protein